LAAHLLPGLALIAITSHGVTGALPARLHVGLETSPGGVALHERVVLAAELTRRANSSGAHAKERVAKPLGIALSLFGVTHAVVGADLQGLTETLMIDLCRADRATLRRDTGLAKGR
jgi:hypothetical protein